MRICGLLVVIVASLGPSSAIGRVPVIALDAGHGGAKTGAIGSGGLVEKNVTAQVVARIAARLRAEGFIVIETRTGDDDVDLRERVHQANQAGADVFLSIHCNAVAGERLARRVRGVETYFLSADATDEAAKRLAEEENGSAPFSFEGGSDDPLAAILFDLTVSAAHHDSARLASAVHRSLVKNSGFRDRGVRQAPFAVLNGAAMPAVLVELGFITHPVEGKLLGQAETQETLAGAVVDGLKAFRKTVERRRDGEQASLRVP